MQELRQSFFIAGQNFLKWRRNPRIWMTFIAAFILALMMSDQILSQALRYETSVQIAETYIWTFGDASSVMLSSLLLVLLFIDMPFIDLTTPYYLVRTRRSVWLGGQIIYVILGTVFYNMFLLLTTSILSVPFAFSGNVWSKTAAMLGYGAGKSVTIPVSVKTMESMLPYQCAAAVFGLMLVYTLFIAALMLFLNIYCGNMAGIFGALGINLYGLLLSPEIFQKLFHFTGNLEYKANILCGWLSPLNHATFPMHNFGYDYLPRLSVSICILLILSLVMIGLSGIGFRRYEFSFLQIEE